MNEKKSEKFNANSLTRIVNNKTEVYKLEMRKSAKTAKSRLIKLKTMQLSHSLHK
jgi:hypothetical protein